MDPKYVVLDEHTLGAVLPGGTGLQVLRASVIRGSHHGDGVIALPIGWPGSSRVRPATLADFDVYHVLPPPGFTG